MAFAFCLLPRAQCFAAFHKTVRARPNAETRVCRRCGGIFFRGLIDRERSLVPIENPPSFAIKIDRL